MYIIFIFVAIIAQWSVNCSNLDDYEISDEEFDVRIVGGTEVEVLVPWFAYLRMGSKNFTLPGQFCGSTLISTRQGSFRYRVEIQKLLSNVIM